MRTRATRRRSCARPAQRCGASTPPACRWACPAVAFVSGPGKRLRAMIVPDVPADDVAILTLRAGGGADWSFDANDARAAQAARVEFVARLAAEGVGAEERLAYEIVFGEIVGNAARYTPGPLDLT